MTVLESHISGAREAPVLPIGERVFGPDGTLAANLPDYEPRKPQQDMADLCEQILRDGGQALIEAGTGTGKSFAYLVPAIERGQTVVVSTETIQLQEQLIRKDLPFLERALGRPIRYAIAKGRGNFFCERNTIALIQEEEARLPDLRRDETLRAARDLLSAFYDDWDGDKSTLPLPVAEGLWSEFSGDDSCTGGKCPHSADCAYMKAKADFESAQIIVTNHHYYLLHHYVHERTEGQVCLLPEHRIWIADEGHTLADIAQNVFGVEMRQGQPRRFAQKLLRQLKALKLELDIDWNMPGIESAAEAFFDVFRCALKDEQLFEEFPPHLLAEAEGKMGLLVDTLLPIISGLHKAAREVDLSDIETMRALRMLRMTANGIIDNLRSFFAPPTVSCHDCAGTGQNEETEEECEKCGAIGRLPDPDPPVLYAEVTKYSRDRDGKKHVTLHRKPAETHRIFKGIYAKLENSIFTSATLAAGGSFSAISEELGLKQFDIETLQAKSPFDYSTQVRGYFPQTVPDGKSPDYHDRLSDEILRVVEWTHGRAFILFTSYRDMQAVNERLKLVCPYPLLVQGDMSKDLLIQRFREEPSVLLGVKTFWTGVDIPGQALSCVALVKFPFPQPEAPLVKARCQRIEARGRRSFDVYSLPRAIRDIQQGFGRLIRSRSDRGLFVIFDSRWHTAKYARSIERSLPAFPKSSELPSDWSLEVPPHALYPSECEGRDEPDSCSGDPLPGPSEPDGGEPAPVGGELRTLVETDDGGPGDVFRLDHPGANGGAGAGDSAPRGRALVGYADARGVARGGHATAEAPGTAASDPGCAPTEGESDEARHSARWEFLQAWTEAQYLDRGLGVGPVRDGMTDEERRYVREAVPALVDQWRRVSERAAWLAENVYDPDWTMRDAATARSGVKFGAMRDELIEWAGAGPGEVLDLLGEVLGRLEYGVEEVA